MSLVNVSYPNLLNGVSQQADQLRFSSQGQEQINGMSSVVDGLSKRNPTEHCFKLMGSSLFQNKQQPLVHFINRDEEEKYVVLFYGTKNRTPVPDADYGYIKVWDILTQSEKKVFKRDEDVGAIVAGTAFITWGTSVGTQELDPSQDATGTYNASYFIGRNPKQNLKLLTIADSTFVCNTNRTVRTVPEKSNLASLTNKTVTRSGTVATVNLGTGVSNSVVQVGEVIQVLGTTALAGSVTVTGKPNGTSFTFDTLDVGPTTYTNSISFALGERLVPFDMPHTLIRQADGTFLLERNYWSARGTGNKTSNPSPSFVGKKLNDVFFYRSRLGFLADENVILSENSSFYNFYRTEMSTLLDSDPIDVSTSHSKVTVLVNAVPYSEKLVLFSDEVQFYMTSTDILTPKTASIQQTTEFSSIRNCKPTVVGKNIFFPFSRGEYSGVIEYFTTPDTLEFNGSDITSAIPSYIKGKINLIISSNNEQIVAFTTDNDDEPSTLYIYKYFTSEDQKLQSSWSKWVIDEDVSGSDSASENRSRILGMEFIETNLYLVIDRLDGVYLEKIDIQAALKDEDSLFNVKLDRKITEDGVEAKTNNNDGTTTLTLPYGDWTESIQVIERDKLPETLYTYDSSPENDNVIVSSIFSVDGITANYPLLNRGTTSIVRPLLNPTDSNYLYTTYNASHRKTFYSDVANFHTANSGIANGTICQVVFWSPIPPPFATNKYFSTFHWELSKWDNGNLVAYHISRPYPDIYASDWDEYNDTWVAVGTSITPPPSLPQYPWLVDKWTTAFNLQSQTPSFFNVEKPEKLIRGNFTGTSLTPAYKVGNTIPVLSYSPPSAEQDKKTKITISTENANKAFFIGVPYKFLYQFSNVYLKPENSKISITSGRFQLKTGSVDFSNAINFEVKVSAPSREDRIYKFSPFTTGNGNSLIGELTKRNGTFRFPVLSRNDKDLKIEIVNNSPFESSFLSANWEAFYSARARRI